MTLPTPKHSWNFDKSSGISPKDEVGGATMQIDRAEFRPGKDGKADTSLRFNPAVDAGARVVRTSVTELSSATWTASMWIKHEAHTGVATLLSSPSAILRLEQYGTARKLGVTKRGVEDHASGDEIPVDDRWAHLVFVGTESTTTIYINGEARAAMPCSIKLPLKWIGSTDGTGDFGAFLLDELKVFAEALTAAQVKELYDESSKPGAGVTPALKQLWSWGVNNVGQLGNGSQINGSTPQPGPVFSRAGIKAISLGDNHSLALLEDGTVWAWGSNHYSQLGNGDTQKVARPAPVEASLLAGLGVKAISARGSHSLALLEDGAVWIWGFNGNGEHGARQATTFEGLEKVPRFGKDKAIAVAAGGDYSLALLENGTVLAWGSNSVGQLGNGTVLGNATLVGVLIPSSCGRVKAISAGSHHGLALLEDGTVWAWGNNGQGALGNTNSGNCGPMDVSGLNKPVIAIAAGGNHSLALLEDGTVWAWGANTYGEVGNGTTVLQATPVQVLGLRDVKVIAAGARHSMALKGDGTVWVWGADNCLELGNGSNAKSTTPVQLVGLSGIKAIAAGGSHSLAGS